MMMRHPYLACGGLAIGLSLVTFPGWHSLAAQTTMPAEGFRPSTQGKKLLHFRGPSFDYMKNHTAEMEEIAFDGLIIGGELPFYHKVDAQKLDQFAEKMSTVPFKRYADNFYLCYSAAGERDKQDFDWFHDLDWVVENWRLMAMAASKGRFKGICFDTEYYAGVPLLSYARAKGKDTRSFREYEDRVYEVAAEIMRAVNESFPDITIICLFGFSAGHYGVPQHPVSAQHKYTLLPAFVDGLLSECRPGALIFDQHEPSFSSRVPGSYARMRALMVDLMTPLSRNPDRYRRYHRAGFSFWADCWGDNRKGRAFDVEDFEVNYYTPGEMAYSIHHALAYSDRYVWMWPGPIRWWDRTVKTLNENGKEVDRPIPAEYVDALRIAHEPSVPEPTRQRRAHMWRVEKAEMQEGWSDEDTFGDLRNAYDVIADLPTEWRFQTDWDEVGIEGGWYKSDFDDSDWPPLKIREFWEVQGYSPYDGCAWYRLAFKVPEVPEGKRLFLAFGGVSDEAMVWVAGRLAYQSPYGDNIRHKRFLVDVTEDAKSGRLLPIAVRVWNTGWCGGIWKNVKFIAGH